MQGGAAPPLAPPLSLELAPENAVGIAVPLDLPYELIEAIVRSSKSLNVALMISRTCKTGAVFVRHLLSDKSERGFWATLCAHIGAPNIVDVDDYMDLYFTLRRVENPQPEEWPAVDRLQFIVRVYALTALPDGETKKELIVSEALHGKDATAAFKEVVPYDEEEDEEGWERYGGLKWTLKTKGAEMLRNIPAPVIPEPNHLHTSAWVRHLQRAKQTVRDAVIRDMPFPWQPYARPSAFLDRVHPDEDSLQAYNQRRVGRQTWGVTLSIYRSDSKKVLTICGNGNKTRVYEEPVFQASSTDGCVMRIAADVAADDDVAPATGLVMDPQYEGERGFLRFGPIPLHFVSRTEEFRHEVHTVGGQMFLQLKPPEEETGQWELELHIADTDEPHQNGQGFNHREPRQGIWPSMDVYNMEDVLANCLWER